MNNPAAWHPDPTGAHEYRWWDGERWTEHVADNGQASVDPLSSAPAGGDGASAAGSTGSSASGVSASTAGASAGGASPDTDPLGESEPTTGATTAGSAPWQTPRATPWQTPGAAETTAPRPAQSWQQAPPAWSAGGATAGTSTANGIAVAAMVIGILSLVVSIVPLLGLLGGLGGILALVLGFVGKNRATAHGVGRGAAITGIATGILALVVSVVSTAGFLVVGGDAVSGYAECISSGGTETECQDELNRGLLDRFGR